MKEEHAGGPVHVCQGALSPGDVAAIEGREFGEDRYCYIQSERYRIGRVVTLRPHEGDTNFDFEERMHRTVQWLYAQKKVISVSLYFAKRAGSYVDCTMIQVLPPEPAPIDRDLRLAGGRVDARGARGSGVTRRALREV